MQRSLIIRLIFLAMFGFISACSTQLSVATDVFQTPHVNLKGKRSNAIKTMPKRVNKRSFSCTKLKLIVGTKILSSESV